MGLFGYQTKNDKAIDRLQSENKFMSLRLQAALGRGGSETASGADVISGRFGYDPNIEMRAPKLWLNLDLMEADSHVKGTIRQNTLPLVNAQWEVKPASEDERDIEIANLVACNILNQTNDDFGRECWPSTPWTSQRLPEILRCLRDGFSLFNFTMRREGTRMVFDRFQWIEPDTLSGIRPWEIDEFDNLLGVNRNFRTGTDQFKFNDHLPVESLKLYIWDFVGARFSGRSIHRSQFGAWFRKERLLRFAAMWAQKIAVPAPMGLYPEDWEPEMVARFEEFVMAMRGSSNAEAMLMASLPTSGKEPVVKYVGSEIPDVDRVGSLITLENTELAHAAGTKSQQLGETASGTRALGKDQRQGEMILVSATAKIICDQINNGIAGIPGVVQHLVDLNYQGVRNYPTVVCSKIDPDEGLRANEKLGPLVKEGIVPNHRALRKQVTERLGYKLPEAAYDEEPTVAPQEPPSPPGLPEDEKAPRVRKEDRGEREVAAAHLESRQEFTKRVGDMLKPVKEGAPRTGGRFPESDGA